MRKKETHPMTKEQCQQLSDIDLLEMVKESQGHTKDFSDYMNCDFSYSYLTSLIRDRGYENGWHKTSEGSPPSTKATIIPMKRSDDTIIRQSFMLDQQVAKEWKNFNQSIPYKTVTISWALRRFMNDVQIGRIKFEIDIRNSK